MPVRSLPVMARTPLLNIRVDDDTKARWEAAARDSGYSLAEYIREAVDARVEIDAPTKGKRKPAARSPKPTPPDAQSGKSGSRSGMCVHRRRSDQYCSRCD